MSKRIHWPEHCRKCQFRSTIPGNYGAGNSEGRYICCYCLTTGHSLVKEYGHIDGQAIRDTCQHYLDAPFKAVDEAGLIYKHGTQRQYEDKESRNKHGLEMRQKLYDEMQKLYGEGLPDKAIAIALGIKPYRVIQWRDRNHLQPNKAERISEGELKQRRHEYWLQRKAVIESDPAWIAKNEARKQYNNQVQCLYDLGLNDREIADRMGRSDKTIYKWRKARGLPSNFNPGGAPKERE